MGKQEKKMLGANKTPSQSLNDALESARSGSAVVAEPAQLYEALRERSTGAI